MIWRLAYHLVGRDAFIAAVRDLLASGKTETDGLTLARLRGVLNDRGGATFKTILDQELDQPTDMDLLVGVAATRGWTVGRRVAQHRFVPGESDGRSDYKQRPALDD